MSLFTSIINFLGLILSIFRSKLNIIFICTHLHIMTETKPIASLSSIKLVLRRTWKKYSIVILLSTFSPHQFALEKHMVHTLLSSQGQLLEELHNLLRNVSPKEVGADSFMWWRDNIGFSMNSSYFRMSELRNGGFVLYAYLKREVECFGKLRRRVRFWFLDGE